MRRVATALVHYPVLDRGRQVVTTAITNLDLHDIARSAHTFGLSDYFVIHPIAAQRELAERVQRHWTSGSGARRIPDRTPALSNLRIVPSLDDAVAALGEPELWVTSAGAGDKLLSFASARQRLEESGPPILLVFGTGWGLAPEVLQRAAFQLEPVRSPRPDGYNHLSVRAAAAIIFDRLLGLR
ncbi:MAG: RNA methyltransferase [Myxococcota bacterium]